MMRYTFLYLYIILLVSVLLSFTRAQTSFSPASIPLAVRSPYLSTWLINTNDSQPIGEAWAVPWKQPGPAVGWRGKIKIDGVTYTWMGHDLDSTIANVTNIQLTPTRSIYTMQTGPMNLTATFLSPIEPSDWVKQSLPFSYLSVNVTAADGKEHDVQLYTDISPVEWIPGNASNPATWTKNATSNTFYLLSSLTEPRPFTESDDRPLDGTVYYAMLSSIPGTTWQMDTFWNTRLQFFANLSSLNDAAVDNIVSNDNLGLLSAAYAVDLGTISATSSPLWWAVGYVRDPSVKYTTSAGAQQERVPYYTTQYSSIEEAIDAFTGDYEAAATRATALDKKLMDAATGISPDYADLVSLSLRQVLGSIDITVSRNSHGDPDPADVMVFMKDIGVSGRVNPVEHMYAAFPAFLYLNASLGGAMLAPLLQAQDGLINTSYAAQDLGLSYPVASGVRFNPQLGIEQSANMLIMLYAHARASGDGSLISQHYNLTKRWADYLVNNTLVTHYQSSGDRQASANMTNLAIKGIIGVKAMAEISRTVDAQSDAQAYDAHASTLFSSWKSLAEASDQSHLLGVYGDEQSWALMYNLYADKLLGTNMVPQSVIDGETKFYASLFSEQNDPRFGLPFDSSSGSTANMAWLMFTAAFANNDSVRDQLIKGAWRRAGSNTVGTGALPNLYDNTAGSLTADSGQAGPALGAIFAPLALTVPNVSITVPSASSPRGNPNQGGNNVPPPEPNKLHILGTILGGAMGGVAIVVLAVVAYLYTRRVRRTTLRKPTNTYSITSDAACTAYSDAMSELAPPLLPPTSSSLSCNYSPSPSISHFPYDLRREGRDLAKGRAAMSAVPLSQPDQAPSLGLSNGLRSAPKGPRSARSDRVGESDLLSESGTTTDVRDIRTEMERMRREVAHIREERLVPPPVYSPYC